MNGAPAGLPLAPVDEANMVIDRPGQVNVFLAAGILSPGGFIGGDGTLDLEALRHAVRRRIDGLPALRRVAAPRGRRHVWVEAAPDLREHIRTAPPLRDRRELERWCGSLMATPLRLTRPLWEMLVAPLEEGRTAAFVLRIHHATADGVAAVEIVRTLLGADDASPSSAPSRPGRLAPGTPGPRAPALLRILRGARRAVTMIVAGRVGPTVLLGPRSALHGAALIDADMDALRLSARAGGATVNDALLAAVTCGLRAALTSAGEPVPAELPVSVPVALERRGTAGNQVGVMIVPLPLSAATPGERLTRIAGQTRQARARARAQGTLELMRGPIAAAVMDRIARSQHLVAGFVTNVRGPSETLLLAGARVESFWPVAVIAGNVRVGVAAVSYAGRLFCSVHCDAQWLSAHVIAAAMHRELRSMTGHAGA